MSSRYKGVNLTVPTSAQPCACNLQRPEHAGLVPTVSLHMCNFSTAVRWVETQDRWSDVGVTVGLHMYINTAAYLACHTKDLGVQRRAGWVVG